MKSRNWRRILGTFVAFSLLALLSMPTQAGVDDDRTFPEGWSIVFYDVTGFPIECIDFVICSKARCPARAFYAGVTGYYLDVTSVEFPGRSSTSVVFNGNHLFGDIWPNRKTILDIDCGRRGFALWRVAEGFGPGSCGGVATYFFQTGFGILAGNEGLSGVTIAGLGRHGGGRCAQLISPMKGERAGLSPVSAIGR